MLTSRRLGDLFVEVERNRTLSELVSEAESDGHPDSDQEARDAPARLATPELPEPRRAESLILLRLSSFDVGIASQLIVDDLGRLFLANARARTVFGLGDGDVGRPMYDLRLLDPPYDLRSIVEQAYDEQKPIVSESILCSSLDGAPRWFDVVVAPFLDPAGNAAGASISFLEVTQTRHLRKQLADSRGEIESANQRLKSANAALETTSDRLYSTVERLESANEELQSTNEELATMNVELESANSELQRVSDELHQRSASLSDVERFLESIFISLRSAIAVLDRELRVLVWNRQAEEMWGVPRSEAELTPFFDIDVTRAFAGLAQAARSCLSGALATYSAVEPARTREGRAILCRATILPLLARHQGRPQGVILLMDESSPVQSSLEAGIASSTGEAARILRSTD